MSMGISETKKRIVIDNYFKTECDIDTTIRAAFEKGFELGLQKAPKERKTGKWIPITENLPETPGFYFVTYKDDDDRGNEFINVTEGAWTGREWVKDFLKKLDVIAWMPKTGPYKEIDE